MKFGHLTGRQPNPCGDFLTMVINHLLTGMIFQVQGGPWADCYKYRVILGPYKWRKITGPLGLCHPTYRGYAVVPPLITGRVPPCSWKTAIFNREFQPRKMNVSHPRSGLFNRKGLSSNDYLSGDMFGFVGVYLQRVHGKVIYTIWPATRLGIHYIFIATENFPSLKLISPLKHVLFSSRFAEMIQFDFHIFLSNGLVQPPTKPTPLTYPLQK